ISTMSCGQRSQVALGLILAQNADLLVLDDFSLGLDPGYRRLFVEYLQEYAVAEDKTVFMTSHIIQDLERLIDDCIILDYGKILTHCSVDSLLRDFKCFTLSLPEGAVTPDLTKCESIVNPSVVGRTLELFTFGSRDSVAAALAERGLATESITRRKMSLEDAFIGLTGKY
ncbi:MAG: ABC transporter ATP-binding protein, partial [Muribaculaceae bacterium]|nr:ABC transporter ATP-binding protein [Muribaculaceae bacterium]